MKVKVRKYNNRDDVNRRQKSRCIKITSRIFAPAFTVSDTLTFEDIDLEKFEHEHSVQYSLSRHSMANTTIA